MFFQLKTWYSYGLLRLNGFFFVFVLPTSLITSKIFSEIGLFALYEMNPFMSSLNSLSSLITFQVVNNPFLFTFYNTTFIRGQVACN